MDRDLDHAHAMGRDRTRVGGSTDALSCLTEQTHHVDRSKWVWWRTWVLIIICFTKQTRHVNRSIWVWWRTWVLCRPCMWVPDIVIISLCVTSMTSNIHQNNTPRLFEEWIEKGHQRDANLCGAYARPTNKLSFVRERGVYNSSFVYFAKA